jgi:hypothetical protein
MIIDSHVHIGPSLSLGTEVKAEYIEESMERAGIDRCLVFPFPSYGEVHGCEWILEVCDEHRSFIPVFYVTESLELPDDRFFAVKWHWVGGVSDSYSNYETLRNEKLPDFAKRVVDLDIPVIFEEEFRFTSLFVRKFPEVKLIIPHLGLLGGNPYEFLEKFRGFDSVYFDTSLASPSTIAKFLEVVGSDRVLFGSDIPFGEMLSELNKIKSLELNKTDERKVLCENVKRLCRLIK